MKMRVIVQGSEEIDLGADDAAIAILAAISGESGEDVRSEIIDYTDTERSGISCDEYAIVTGDDGTVLWQGWLDSDKDDVPPPVGVQQPEPADDGPGSGDWQQQREADAAYWGRR